MNNDLSVIPLNRRFDPQRLQQDLDTAVSRFQSAAQAGGYHDGSWTGISLRSVDGSYKNTFAVTAASVSDTEVLSCCPYFKEILDSLPFPIGVTRLLFLPPGKMIGEHRDQGLGWERGVIRLHIPIVTHPDVIFNIDGKEVYWREGEFWYGDFSKPHYLHNQSPVTRVHMVIDAMVAESTFDCFPEDVVRRIKESHQVLLHKDMGDIADRDMSAFTGHVRVPGEFIGLPFPLRAQIHQEGKKLRVQVFGLPFEFSFTPINESTFRQLEYELRYQLGAAGEQADRVSLQLVEHLTDRRCALTLKQQPHLLDRVFESIQAVGLGSLIKSYKMLAFLTQRWKRASGKLKPESRLKPMREKS